MDRFVRKYGRYVPFALTIIIIICCALFLKDHEFSEILSYCPDNLWLAAFVILGLPDGRRLRGRLPRLPAGAFVILGFYGLKSLSVVFPLAAIFVCVGAIYPFWVGILLNVIGLSVCFTVPYLVGRISGGDIMRVIEMKYPKARKLVNYGHDNNLFASYISRAVVVVPGDLVSMIHGALRMPYRPYLLGSIMGVMPEMLVQTYIGAQLKHLTIKSVLVMIALIVATLAFSLILNKKVSRSGKQMDKEDF